MQRFYRKGGHPCVPYVDYYEKEEERNNKKYRTALNNILKTKPPSEEIEIRNEDNNSSSRVVNNRHHHGKSINNLNIRKLTPRTFNHVLIVSFLLVILLAFLTTLTQNKSIELTHWILFYTFELMLLYKVIKYVDSIRVNSDLRIWGLRLMSGVFVAIAIFTWIFMMFSIFNPHMFWGMFIMTIGLLLIAGYLGFKFMRKSGHIVYYR